jgi:hypothetical protein
MLLEKMGVKISLTKTHVGKTTYEFAKRWIQDGIEITGIPTKGIIHNFRNQFIVFTILYDFYKVKNNLYVSKHSLCKVVSNLYFKFKFDEWKLKIKNRKKTFKLKSTILTLNLKERSKVKSFSLALDLTFNHYSYDKLREYFALNTVKRSEYMLPTVEVARSEMERVLLAGLASTIRKFNNTIFDDPFKFFKEEQRKDAENFPIFTAMFNQVSSSWDLLTLYKNKKLSMYEVSKKLSLLDMESTFNKDRNIIMSLVNVGTIARRGFYKLNNPWGDELVPQLNFKEEDILFEIVQRNSVNFKDSWVYKERKNSITSSPPIINMELPKAFVPKVDPLWNIKEIHYLYDLTYDTDNMMRKYGRFLEKSKNPDIQKLGQLFQILK